MQETSEEVVALARKRVRARIDLVMHLVLYAVVNVALILIWAFTGRGYPWFVWVLFGWGIGIVGHVLTLAFGPGSSREAHAVDREVRRLRAQEIASR